MYLHYIWIRILIKCGYYKNFFSYFSVEDALRELEIRKKDRGLQRLVENEIGNDFYKVVDNKFVISRPCATPNFEFTIFNDHIVANNKKGLVLEYPSLFVTKNKDKLFLAKVVFCDKDKKNNSSQYQIDKLVKISESEGLELSKLQTKYDISLIDYHHRFFKLVFKDTPIDFLDFTEWFNHARTNRLYYYKYLLLFVTHGILFENFLVNNPDEKVFFNKKILPSYIYIYKKIKVKPLIVRLVPKDEEDQVTWSYYDVNNVELINKV